MRKFLVIVHPFCEFKLVFFIFLLNCGGTPGQRPKNRLKITALIYVKFV